MAEAEKELKWDLIAWDRASGFISRFAPSLTALGLIGVLALFGFGLYLIGSLIGRVWDGTADDTVQAASAALTAIAAIFGAMFLFWRTLVAHWLARAAQKQAIISQETHYTTLFTKATEQLGATKDANELIDITAKNGKTRKEIVTLTKPNLELRIGAIYALERIAQDSKRDYWPIMEVLGAYISDHQNSGPAKTPPATVPTLDIDEWFDANHRPRADVTAAITVISRRNASQLKSDLERKEYLNFQSAIIQGLVLEGNFSSVDFGSANLAGTGFVGATFEQSSFLKSFLCGTSLVNCQFSKYRFHSTKITKTFFSRTEIFDCAFENAVFESTEILKLKITDTEFTDVSFGDCDFGKMELKNVALFGSDLSKATALTESQLTSTFGDASTKLPQKLKRPDHWPNKKFSKDERKVIYKHLDS